MKPIAQDTIVAVAMGVIFWVAWHNRRHIRRYAGQLRWKIDRHGRYLRSRQVDTHQWVHELSTYCVSESAKLRDRDAMIYGELVTLRDRFDEVGV